MKKLNKLEINPQKIIHDSELLTLKGGECWWCVVICGGSEIIRGQGCGPDCASVISTCNSMWGGGGCYCLCDCSPGY